MYVYTIDYYYYTTVQRRLHRKAIFDSDNDCKSILNEHCNGSVSNFYTIPKASKK